MSSDKDQPKLAWYDMNDPSSFDAIGAVKEIIRPIPPLQLNDETTRRIRWTNYLMWQCSGSIELSEAQQKEFEQLNAEFGAKPVDEQEILIEWVKMSERKPTESMCWVFGKLYYTDKEPSVHLVNVGVSRHCIKPGGFNSPAVYDEDLSKATFWFHDALGGEDPDSIVDVTHWAEFQWPTPPQGVE